MTSATLVLVGVGCFIGGVFILTQYQGRVGSPWIVGIAVANPVIDLARVCADLGLQGDAHLLLRDRQIVQIVPVGDLPPTVLPPDDYSFISDENGGGVHCCPRAGPSTTGWYGRTVLLFPMIWRGSALQSARWGRTRSRSRRGSRSFLKEILSRYGSRDTGFLTDAAPSGPSPPSAAR